MFLQTHYSDYSNYSHFNVQPYYESRFGVPALTLSVNRVKHDYYNIFREKYKNEIRLVTRSTYVEFDGVKNSIEIWEWSNIKSCVKIETNRLTNQKRIFGECDTTMYVYYCDETLIVDLIKELRENYYELDPPKHNPIKLVIANRTGGLESKEFNIKIDDIDIELNYGKNFKSIYDTIVDKLNTSDSKGLVLLHGTPGTGKTSLIKYIAKHLNKEVLFIPPSLGNSLSSPEFLPFLIDHSNSVLVIEDAEKIIGDREVGGAISTGVSNILNISDGILGDCLNIQILATFNTKKDKIDQALLRKGRLIAEYEFGPLTVEDSNNLLSHLNKNHTTLRPMTLTDIYNFDEVEYRSQKEREAVGFKR